jgi:hypothetical protein
MLCSVIGLFLWLGRNQGKTLQNLAEGNFASVISAPPPDLPVRLFVRSGIVASVDHNPDLGDWPDDDFITTLKLVHVSPPSWLFVALFSWRGLGLGGV